jgi:hypothetical protein
MISFESFAIVVLSCNSVTSSVTATIIPKVIYEHGELWPTDVDKEKILICSPQRSLEIQPPEPASSISGGSGRRKLWILCNKYLFHTRRVL